MSSGAGSIPFGEMKVPFGQARVANLSVAPEMLSAGDYGSPSGAIAEMGIRPGSSNDQAHRKG
jgi:hypothetical protein